MTTNYSAQNKERYGTVAMIIKQKHNGVKIFMEPQLVPNCIMIFLIHFR